jgi:FlaA1/EpsC-like NDP-sugar epimerase
MHLAFYRKYRTVLITVAVALQAAISMVSAFLLRFEYTIPKMEAYSMWTGVWLAVVVKVLAFRLTGCQKLGWRHIGIFDLTRLFTCNIVGSIAFAAASIAIVGPRFPRSVYVIDCLLFFLLTAGSRVSVRLYYETIVTEIARSGKKRLLIYGAGSAGMTLAREIRSNPTLGYRLVGFIDDDPRKRALSLLGAPVLGCGRELPIIAKRLRKKVAAIDELIIAMPSASSREIREALANCRAASLVCKTIPTVGELLAGKVLTSQIRNVTLDDLLGRDPVQLDEGLIRSCICGKIVMVTGGGGSIGSELCRQLASYCPEKLIVFERAESDLFETQLDLLEHFPSVTIIPEIGDIREYARIERVIRHHHVNSVFHAAAYKHVPMMEAHLIEAVKNNVLGTWNVAKASYRNGVSSLLMISSDKAVNPTNIMGLTKRVAELIVSAMPTAAEGSPTRCVSVRFGNVLGSKGSVVPIFSKQIRAGGPITVTHPEARRYFMTIPEAVQLILQASTMGQGSEVFVLDMGEPIRIVDLARNMIRLSGREPDVDVEIRFVGLRPGEKLYEEVITKGENILPTYHEKIRIFRGQRHNQSEMNLWLTKLEELVSRGEEESILDHLRVMVPEYEPSERWQDEQAIAATAGSIS